MFVHVCARELKIVMGLAWESFQFLQGHCMLLPLPSTITKLSAPGPLLLHFFEWDEIGNGISPCFLIFIRGRVDRQSLNLFNFTDKHLFSCCLQGVIPPPLCQELLYVQLLMPYRQVWSKDLPTKKQWWSRTELLVMG